MLYGYTLPYRVLLLIKEYSKPLTRPDWRTIHKMTKYHLFFCITQNTISNELSHIILNNMRHNIWSYMYEYIETWGIYTASIHFNLSIHEIMKLHDMYIDTQ